MRTGESGQVTVFFRTIFLLLCLLLAGCSAQPHEPSQAESWPEPNSHCSSAGVLLDAHFEAGNLG